MTTGKALTAQATNRNWGESGEWRQGGWGECETKNKEQKHQQQQWQWNRN